MDGKAPMVERKVPYIGNRTEIQTPFTNLDDPWVARSKRVKRWAAYAGMGILPTAIMAGVPLYVAHRAAQHVIGGHAEISQQRPKDPP